MPPIAALVEQLDGGLHELKLSYLRITSQARAGARSRPLCASTARCAGEFWSGATVRTMAIGCRCSAGGSDGRRVGVEFDRHSDPLEPLQVDIELGLAMAERDARQASGEFVPCEE
jgi:hypothetical protein